MRIDAGVVFEREKQGFALCGARESEGEGEGGLAAAVDGRIDAKDFAVPALNRGEISRSCGCIELHDAARKGIGRTIGKDSGNRKRVLTALADKAVFAQQDGHTLSEQALHLIGKVLGEQQQLHIGTRAKGAERFECGEGVDGKTETLLLVPEVGKASGVVGVGV